MSAFAGAAIGPFRLGLQGQVTGANEGDRLTDPSERFKPDRLNAVSDGIFSVALTLLILDIKPPSTGSVSLGEALLMLAPHFGVLR
jgi:hypothetical protein